MSPRFKDGERINIDYDYYKTHEIHRGDIVICRFTLREAPVIKIVQAVPGDKFELEKADGSAELLVNGLVVKNSAGIPYKFSERRKKMLSLYERDYRGVIPPDAYLLLGDIPDGSLDSGSIGLIGRSAIAGKAEKLGGK